MNNKVIKVLDREHGKKVIEFWKKYCDTVRMRGDTVGHYYGIINGQFDSWSINEVRQNNAEIIELPEEKTYPRVMLVSLDKKYWQKRVVFMEKCGGFLAWSGAETLEEAENETYTYFWKYAKEIEPIQVTLEEIAKWKGTSKEQIIIKNECRKNNKQKTKRAFNVRGSERNYHIVPDSTKVVKRWKNSSCN